MFYLNSKDDDPGRNEKGTISLEGTSTGKGKMYT